MKYLILLLFSVLLFLPLHQGDAQNYDRRQVIRKIRDYEKQRIAAWNRGDYKKAISLSWQIAESYELIKQQGLMVKYYEKAIYVAKLKGDSSLFAQSHERLGDAYKMPDFYTKKSYNYQRAAATYENLKEFEKAGELYRKIVKISHQERDYETMIPLAETLLEKKDKFDITRNDRINLSTVLMEAHTKQGSAEKVKLFEIINEKARSESPDPRDKKRQLDEALRIDPMLLSQREVELLRTQKIELRSDIDSQQVLIQQKQAEAERNRLEAEKNEALARANKLIAERKEAEAKEKEAEAKLANAEAAMQKARNGQFILALIAGGIVLVISIIAFLQKVNSNRKLAKINREIEAERAKSDNLLLNILPQETAQELKETGHAEPKSYDMVTVMFTDFKGFTQISEKLSPKELVKKLEYCFTEFDKICERNKLEKIKTIGDAYMCAGGIPVANTTNAKDAVRAGLEMQKFMKEWKQMQDKLGEPAFELRLGIHTGSVVAGVIGKNKFAYDIWGDAVNLAARMESSGEVGKVNISESTYHLVKDEFDCEYRGKITAKNKGEIDMYFVNQ